jgi:hypothetical protein
MLFSGELYIGIDLTRGEKSIHYAALNQDLEPITLTQGNYKSLISFLGGQQKAALGIHGPARPNLEILTNAERRSQFLIEMGKGRPGNMRVAEYELKRLNLPTYQTPHDESSAPKWMQTSFRLFEYLKKLNYSNYSPSIDADLQVMEVLPEVSFRAWVDGAILPKNTFYGRMQRQLILYDRGIHLPDPMDFFEEITRFKIRQGILPANTILNNGTLSALGAAYMAWQTRHEPEKIALVGLVQEGQIAVPAKMVTI